MEHKTNHLRLVADNEAKGELKAVADAIRPLPQEVEPSKEFLGELRMRLLELEPRKARGGHSRRAA